MGGSPYRRRNTLRLRPEGSPIGGLHPTRACSNSNRKSFRPLAEFISFDEPKRNGTKEKGSPRRSKHRARRDAGIFRLAFDCCAVKVRPALDARAFGNARAYGSQAALPHPWLGRKTAHILCAALRVCKRPRRISLRGGQRQNRTKAAVAVAVAIAVAVQLLALPAP